MIGFVDDTQPGRYLVPALLPVHGTEQRAMYFARANNRKS